MNKSTKICKIAMTKAIRIMEDMIRVYTKTQQQVRKPSIGKTIVRVFEITRRHDELNKQIKIVDDNIRDIDEPLTLLMDEMEAVTVKMNAILPKDS